MVLDGIWNIWPFKGSSNTRCTRRITKSSRCNRDHSEPLIQFLGPWELNMVALQSILIWEKPGKSIVAIALVNIIYWCIAISEVRFFFGISALGLATFLHHQWVHAIWPEISVPSQTDQEEWTPVHPSVLSAPEVSRYIECSWDYIKEQQSRLAQLRRRQPAVFCGTMVSCFCILWIVGHYVSGVALLHGMLMGLMCGPALIIKVVPKSAFTHLGNFTSAVFGRGMGDSCSSLENDIAEFLPEETSEEAQTALGIPLTCQGVTLDDMDDEKPSSQNVKELVRGKPSRGRRGRSRYSTASEGSSFTAGLCENDFPSVEETLDCVEESDLALPMEEEEEPAEGIAFVATHFGDTSDEDDDFAAGLSFRGTASHPQSIQPTQSLPVSVVDHIVSSMAAENTANILSSIGQHLVSVMGSRPLEVAEANVPKMTISASSIEEDFELISDDDFH